MTLFPSPSAAEQRIATVLDAYPQSIGGRETLVLTTFPPLWTRRQVSAVGEGKDPTEDPPHLIDVTSVLGADTILKVGGGHSKSENLAAALADAGWAASRIAQEYRPDWKSAKRFDVAVLDEDGSPFLVVESAASTEAEADLAAAKAQLAQYGEKEGVSWLCLHLSDQRWALFPAGELDRVRDLAQPPSPKDCGAGDRDALVDQLRESVVEPASLAAVHELIEDRNIRKLVLGSTLPWRGPFEEAEKLAGWLESASELDQRLRSLNARLRYSIEPLLAWSLWTPLVEHTAAVFPLTYLSGERYRWLRELSADVRPPAAILENASGSIFKHTSVRTALGFFSSGQEQTFFCSISTDGTQSSEPPPCLKALEGWFEGEGPDEGYVTRVDSETPWTFAANDPEIDQIQERLARLGELSSLSEQFSVTRGRINPEEAGDESVDEDGLVFLDAHDIGRASLPEGTTRSIRPEEVDETSRAEAGDFLVSDILEDGVQVARYNRSEPAALSRRVIRLRPNGDPPSTGYLTSYLSCPAVERLLLARVQSFSDSVPRLKVSELRKLPVPELDYEALDEIEGIEELEQDLMHRAEEIADQRRSLFNAQGPEDFRHKARNLRESSMMLSEGLKLADSLDYKIRNFYPYPLAFPYRSISAETSIHERYREQVRFGENLLAFLVSLCLAIVEPSDRKELENKIGEQWIGGMSPGKWLDVGGAAASILGRYEEHRLADFLARLQMRSEKRGIGPHLRRFVEMRNAYKHNRWPTNERGYRQAIDELEERFGGCLEQLSFLSGFPIRQVAHLDTDRQGANMVLSCLRYTGDHPGLPREEVQMPVEVFAQQPIKKGDLYIALGEGHWRSLRPFMLSRDCPQCGSREVYFLEKLDPHRAQAQLKSFERGHTIGEEEAFVEDVLSWVGENDSSA